MRLFGWIQSVLTVQAWLRCCFALLRRFKCGEGLAWGRAIRQVRLNAPGLQVFLISVDQVACNLTFFRRSSRKFDLVSSCPTWHLMDS